jgi:Uma2 family endonuclease
MELVQQFELRNGDRMSLDEFFSTWEEIPDLKGAELIDGAVHLAGPVTCAHGVYHSLLMHWLNIYAGSREGLVVLSRCSHKLLGDSLQPDISLHPVPFPDADFPETAPLLVIEITYSARSIDLGPKLDLYRRAQTPEHLCILLAEQRVEWRVLEGETYRLLRPTPEGILESPTQPELRLDTTALFPLDRKRLLSPVPQLSEGVQTPASVTPTQSNANTSPNPIPSPLPE